MQAELFRWKSGLLMAPCSCSYKGFLDFRGPDYLSDLVKRDLKNRHKKKQNQESSLLVLQIEIIIIKKKAYLFVFCLFVLGRGGVSEVLLHTCKLSTFSTCTPNATKLPKDKLCAKPGSTRETHHFPGISEGQTRITSHMLVF